MRITQLRQILEIEKCRSISQAAHNLFVSQPALSTLLNDFEKEVGVQLFNRSNLGIVPTPDGERLLAMMREVVSGLDNIQNYAQEIDSLAGEITLYIGPAYHFLIPDILKRFKQACPKMDLHFLDSTMDLPNLVDAIRKHLCSFAVGCIYPGAYKSCDRDIVMLPLSETNVVLLANQAHPLCQKTPLALTDIFDEQIVVLENLSWETLVANDFLKQPFTRTPLLYLDRLSIFQLLAENAVIALAALPLGKATYEPHYPFLKVLPFHEPLQMASWQTYLLYNQRTCTRAENVLLAELKNLLAEKQLLEQ